jgi:hypothetical protein
VGKPNFKDKSIASKAGAKSKPGKHEKTKQWEALGELITGKLTDKVLKYLDSLPPGEMFDAYLKMLEYFKPKLTRAEIKADVSTHITQCIEKAFEGLYDDKV